MKVVGLDISTYLGMSMLTGDEEETRSKCLHFDGLTGFQRLAYLRDEFERVLDAWQPDVAVAEGYNYNNHFTLVTLVEVGTVVRQVLYDRKIPWYEVPPTTLKKWVTGKGGHAKAKVTKALMATAAKERWGFENPSDDIVDAHGLARMGITMGLTGLLSIKGVSQGC